MHGEVLACLIGGVPLEHRDPAGKYLRIGYAAGPAARVDQVSACGCFCLEPDPLGF